MKLRPIDEDSIPDAAAILSRGFPERTASFWEAGLHRLAEYRQATNVPPIGQMMMFDGKAVGVILTIASKRADAGIEREVVNLSSWYVDAKYRWLAPRMLQSIVADGSVTFTDFSPTPETAKINERLGFRTITQGLLLFFLPWSAIASRKRARVIPLERLPAGALSAAERALLDHHRNLGCIAGALDVDGHYHALLFHPTRWRGLPVARLLLATSRKLVADHIAAIARFLLRCQMLFLTFQGDSSDTAASGIMWNRWAPVQVKGDWDRDRIDQTYSELVFLQL